MMDVDVDGHIERGGSSGSGSGSGSGGHVRVSTGAGGMYMGQRKVLTEGVGASSDLLAVTNRRRVAVRACLPHRSWWLPIRTLKAFLVLQVLSNRRASFFDVMHPFAN